MKNRNKMRFPLLDSDEQMSENQAEKKVFWGILSFIACILFLFLILFLSCKPPQDISTRTTYDEKKDIANDVAVANDLFFHDAILQWTQSLMSERIQFTLSQIKYDTEKPIDPETGKPPIKEESNIDLIKNTETQTNDSSKTEHRGKSANLYIDKTKDNTRTTTEAFEETETKLSRIEVLSICLVIALVIVLIVFLVKKFKK